MQRLILQFTFRIFLVASRPSLVFKMSERRQINSRAVRQMVRLITALIRLLLVELSYLAFLALIAATAVLTFTIGTGGVREEGCLDPSSEIYFRILESHLTGFCTQCFTMLKAIIQRARIQILEIVDNGLLRLTQLQEMLQQILEPEATTSTGVASQPVQEPQTTWSEEIISEGGRIRPPDTSFSARLNLERKPREEMRELEGAMSEKLKLEEEEVVKEEEEEEEETMEED